MAETAQYLTITMTPIADVMCEVCWKTGMVTFHIAALTPSGVTVTEREPFCRLCRRDGTG